MSADRSRYLGKIRAAIVALMVLTAGYIIGNANSQPQATFADVRKTPPRAAFESGSERSETVLRDISATLKRIERRVERIEKSVTAPEKD